MRLGLFGVGHAAEHAARIVDQPVEAAEMLRTVLDDALDIGGKRKITLDEEHFAATVGNGLAKFFGGIAA